MEVRAAHSLAAKAYWLGLLIVAVLTLVGTVLQVALVENRGNQFGEAFGIGLLIIAMALPFGQLIASVLALIYVNVFPPPKKQECLKRLGIISLYAFVWGLIGFGLMVPFAFLLK